jgi:hypothetical protein
MPQMSWLGTEHGLLLSFDVDFLIAIHKLYVELDEWYES